MVKISVTNTSGDTRDIDAETGLSLMEAMRDNDFDDLAALCGGCVSCCTCHVHINADFASKIPQADDDEMALLEDSDNFDAAKSRLSCQVEVTEDMAGLSLTIQAEV